MLCKYERCRFHETLSFEENNVHCEALDPLGKSVLTRSWKYDAEVTEYFVQVSDTVRIKRSDLEKYEKTEDAEETDEFPSIQPKALEDKKDGPGGKPASDLIALAESKENLNKFLDSLHRKASQATTWICSLEPPTLPNPNARQKQYGS